MGGKQKVVVRVHCCDQGKSIALQTVAAGVPGLSSVSLEGAEKDRVVVIGEEIDSYGLIKSLRKKVGCVELLTVGPVEEKKPPPPEQKKPPPLEPKKPPPPEPKKPIESVACLYRSVPCICQTIPRLCPQEHVIYVCELCNPEPICIIM